MLKISFLYERNREWKASSKTANWKERLKNRVDWPKSINEWKFCIELQCYLRRRIRRRRRKKESKYIYRYVTVKFQGTDM